MFLFLFLISALVGALSPILLVAVLTVLGALGFLAVAYWADELAVPYLFFFLVGAAGAWVGWLVPFLYHLKFGT